MDEALKKRWIQLSAISLSAILLASAWHCSDSRAMAVLILLPVVCFYLPSRCLVLLFSTIYFFCITWFFPGAYAGFFQPANLKVGIILYILTLLILILPWVCFYPPKSWPFKWRLLCSFAAIVIITLPPWGLLSPVNFLSSLGYLYPGLGWCGVVLFFTLLLILFILTESAYRNFKNYTILGLLLIVSLVANRHYQPPAAPKNWAALDAWKLPEPYSLVQSEDDFLKQNNFYIQLVKQKMHEGAKTLVLPEDALSIFGSKSQRYWQPLLVEAKKNQVVIIAGGQAVYPLLKENIGFYILKQASFKFNFKRQPMPYTEWQPWNPNLMNSYWFVQNNFFLYKQNVQVSMCYENLIPWLQLWPFAQKNKPSILVTINSLVFAGKYGFLVKNLEYKTVNGFARLFRVPLVEATAFSISSKGK